MTPTVPEKEAWDFAFVCETLLQDIDPQLSFDDILKRSKSRVETEEDKALLNRFNLAFPTLVKRLKKFSRVWSEALDQWKDNVLSALREKKSPPLFGE